MGKFLLGIILMCSLFTSCVTTSKMHTEMIRRIKYTFKMPDKIIENKGMGDTVIFYVSYQGDLIVYELPYRTASVDNGILMYDSLKYEYFIFNRKDSFGYSLKNISDTFLYKKKIDSMLKGRGADQGKGNYDVLKEMKKDSFSEIYNNGSKKIYKYLIADNHTDSSYYYFDNDLIDIEFSFSRQLDSVYNSKLYKMEVFVKHDDSLSKANPALTHFFITSCEIIRDPNVKAIGNLFRHYKQFEKAKFKIKPNYIGKIDHGAEDFQKLFPLKEAK